MLRQIAPGVVWVAALLAAMLSVTQLYAGRPAPTARSSRCCSFTAQRDRRSSLAKAVVALAPDRPAAGRRARRCSACCSTWRRRRSRALVASLVPRHAGAEPARRPGRGADARPAQRRRAADPDHRAALHSGADLRRRRGRRRSMPASRRAGHYSLLGALLIFTALLAPVGDRGGAAHRHRDELDRSTLVTRAGASSASPRRPRFYPLGRRSSSPWFAGPSPRCSPRSACISASASRPTDATQGDAYRIIFIHVPAAWMSMLLYVVMAFWAAIG